MNISHGMNITEVRNVGTRLQSEHAEAIRNLMRDVENMVNNTASTWVGPDGERFRSWWPEKRAALNAIADDLHGFGQSALNNAQQQQDVSEA
ncbi:MAG: WXG100 family type VII secretion target [Acidimicrobiales bacterium]|nr:WXG100 family type VII secretion target [Acidimicrobiales bacterium]